MCKEIISQTHHFGLGGDVWEFQNLSGILPRTLQSYVSRVVFVFISTKVGSSVSFICCKGLIGELCMVENISYLLLHFHRAQALPHPG